ncbi:MAG: hypothetical protein ACRCZO_12410 [Cetobacterium sp.]
MKKDPERYADYLQKEKERYKKIKESGQIKSVSQLTKREKNLKKRQWRINKRYQGKTKITECLKSVCINKHTTSIPI